jgi:hypothetical protein
MIGVSKCNGKVVGKGAVGCGLYREDKGKGMVVHDSQRLSSSWTEEKNWTGTRNIKVEGQEESIYQTQKGEEKKDYT